MKCPNCTGTLIKIKGTGENVKYCSKCVSNWFIILCSKNKEKSMWNKILDFIKNCKEKQKKKPEINIEKLIKNSKDYKDRLK